MERNGVTPWIRLSVIEPSHATDSEQRDYKRRARARHPIRRPGAPVPGGPRRNESAHELAINPLRPLAGTTPSTTDEPAHHRARPALRPRRCDGRAYFAFTAAGFARSLHRCEQNLWFSARAS